MPAAGPTLLELTELLCSTLRIDPPSPPLRADEPLFGGRLPLDSVDSLQWAAAIEQRYGIELTDEELLDGVLLTLGRLAGALTTRAAPLARNGRPGNPST